MTKWSHFTAEEDAAIVAGKAAGRTLREIAKDLGRTRNSVVSRSKLMGEHARSKALRVERVVKAVGEMQAFTDHLGVDVDWDTLEDKPISLNEWMANTWINDRWPDLLKRAAEAAVAALDE